MTQQNQLGTVLGTFLDTEMMPSIVLDLQKKNIETTPYVNAFSETPDNGFMQFFDSPRYSTGYTSLFNTIGFVVETHMLKKYADRVKATYEYMRSTINFMDANYQKIKQMRVQNENSMHLKFYPIKWEIDTLRSPNFHFWVLKQGI
jgi:hypothetical protein